MRHFLFSIKGLLVLGVLFTATETAIGMFMVDGVGKLILMNLIAGAFIIYGLELTIIPTHKDGE